MNMVLAGAAGALFIPTPVLCISLRGKSQNVMT